MFIGKMLDEFKRFNDNVEKLTEVLKDSNILIGKYLGYKVTYKDDEIKEDK